MMQENTARRLKEQVNQGAEVSAEIDRLAFQTLAVAAGIVGAWTLARIAGALFVSGTPLALARSWWQAVTGM